MHSMLLGATPLRTTSRRRLFTPPTIGFATPQTNARTTVQTQQTTNLPTSADNADVTLQTQPGTLVQHITEDGNDLSNQLGVVFGPSTTSMGDLEVLWTETSNMSAVKPDKLKLHTVTQLLRSKQQAMQTSGTTLERPTSAISQMSNNNNTQRAQPQVIQPTLQQYYSKSYKSLLKDKFPNDLQCPLDSIDEHEIEIYQMRMDQYVCSAHPRIR